MKHSIVKYLLIALGFVVFFAVAYVATNTSYFYKQLRFALHKPSIVTQPNLNSNNGSEVKAQPNHLSIPSLGIDAPIVDPSGNKEADFQEALKKGIVHYPGTAAVGQVGNMYVFGHSSDYIFKAGNFKTVFALLPHIQNGAEIFVTDGNGNQFTYKVTNQFIAASTDVKLLDQNTNGKKILTLQTSYPVGTALKRYIVISELE